MLGVPALRACAKDIRAASLKNPHFIDDIRFLLSTRKLNDLSLAAELESTALEMNDNDDVGSAQQTQALSSSLSLDRHSVYVQATKDFFRYCRGSSATDSSDSKSLTQLFWLKRRLLPLLEAVPVKQSKKNKSNLPLSAGASGLVTDICRQQRVSSFAFVDDYLGLSLSEEKVDVMNRMRQVDGDDSASPGVHSTPKVKTTTQHLEDTLHSLVTVVQPEFMLFVQAIFKEPYYKPPTPFDRVLSGAAAEEELEITETTSPIFEIKIAFNFQGKHAKKARVIIVNTHFFVLECEGRHTVEGQLTENISLVEHVGAIDVKSYIELGNSGPRPQLERVSNTQQHSVTVRLATAESEHCIGALKGRIFYKLGDIDQDLTNVPIRCVEFDPVLLSSIDPVATDDILE